MCRGGSDYEYIILLYRQKSIYGKVKSRKMKTGIARELSLLLRHLAFFFLAVRTVRKVADENAIMHAVDHLAVDPRGG